MSELISTLRRSQELHVSDRLAASMSAMAPATVDHRPASDRAKVAR